MWAKLATGLADLINGNGTALYTMFDAGLFQCSCDPLENAFEAVEDAELAISCNDGDVVPSDLESAQEHYASVLRISEWGSLWAGNRLDCASWPDVPKAQFRGPIGGNTSFPLLIIGNKADPVTPLWAAHKVSKGFPGSVVLSQDSAGHASISAPSVCTARVIREYFMNGTLPDVGTWCPIDRSPFDPSYASSNRQLKLGQDGAQTPLKYKSWGADGEEATLAQALRDLATFDYTRVSPLPLHV
ncbi:hypothetical protein PQX77_017351 [Marasmius sp. AFHP31]|nr:hypothetical protein PQX77_017351 [Marasmius sp. AFHP31]